MSLTIQDFALVLGAPCQIAKLGKPTYRSHITSILGTAGSIGTPFDVCKPDEITPVLRPLSSLTETEARELYEIQAKQPFVNTQQGAECLALWMKPTLIDSRHEAPLEWATMHVGTMRWLLARHFDLFGWIESGLAIKQEGA